jgi:hypothetical protein
MPKMNATASARRFVDFLQILIASKNCGNREQAKGVQKGMPFV